MQIDIGFGDIVFPRPLNVDYPTLLDTESPVILGYSPETLIAEKTHAMVRHGLRNSRIKDFFDIWVLSNQFKFNGSQLATALQKTFAQRETEMTDGIAIIFDELLKDDLKHVQWKSFISNNALFMILL